MKWRARQDWKALAWFGLAWLVFVVAGVLWIRWMERLFG